MDEESGEIAGIGDPTMRKEIENLTPMMRQYLQIKERHQDAILFFRLGDFYEMFFEDAVKASELLDIALTSRNKKEEDSVPLCGIPYHSAASYIRKLLEEGCKVAICEQIEDPKQAKGIVKREVTRIITPGLLVEEENLSSGEPNYLATYAQEGEGYGLGLIDISTGEVLVGYYENSEALLQQLLKHQVRELVLPASEMETPLAVRLKTIMPRMVFSHCPDGAEDPPTSNESFSGDFRDSYQKLESSVTRLLLGRLLGYVVKNSRSVLPHLGPIQILKKRQYLRMDERTFRHLELTRSARGEGRGGTLFWVLNKTQTAMGARRLMQWIHYPLLDLEEIRRRQDAVEEFFLKPETVFTVQENLKSIPDVERMLGKLALKTVNARDLSSLGQGLLKAHELLLGIAPQIKNPLVRDLCAAYPNLKEPAENLTRKFLPDLPLTVREGRMIADGIHTELDELRSISRDGKSFIAAMEEGERQRTKISSLKIRYNKVFGYYIEITHAHRDRVPEDYIRKQTLTNAERFITPELKEYENKVLGAEERIKNLEYEIFCEIREECSKHMDELRTAARVLSTLDVLASLARVARDHGYHRPALCEEKILQLKDSRHPVLERIQSEHRFIPNDIQMEETRERLFLITGPNMAGKSTVMRQMALIIILAQMGSFIPAKEAKVGVVDQLFTRIGASDDLSQGQSTFMVEMLETAHLLRNATRDSFIVLDEIGRGTSTFDGMSIAWAVAEFVAKNIGCRAMFATHYHELTELGQTVPGVVNYQVAVKEWNNQILFLRKLIRGGASRSYGIEVARLAGLPDSLLTRAKEVLHELEQIEGQAVKKLGPPSAPAPQLPLFQAPEAPILRELKKLEPDIMSPLEALDFLYKLKGMVQEE